LIIEPRDATLFFERVMVGIVVLEEKLIIYAVSRWGAVHGYKCLTI
jgi:hypothetical protein